MTSRIARSRHTRRARMDKIAHLLTDQPTTVALIVEALKMRQPTVRELPGYLEQEGRAHRKLMANKQGKEGMAHGWLVGPCPNLAELDDTDMLPTVRRFLKKFEPIMRRDPLVAALFGPAGEVAHG